MADIWTSIGDFLGLNKGHATSDASNQNMRLLDQLRGSAGGYLRQAQGGTQNLVDLFGRGANTYADALGINGAEGNTRATGQFQHSPGYQQALDQGNQSILRTAAARGDLGGGGTGIDLMQYGVGAANQDYGNWLQNLSGYNGLYSNATSMNSGALGDLAGLETDITSGKLAANNQNAAGKEAGQGAGWDLLGNIAGVGGRIFGLNSGGGTGGPSIGNQAPQRGFGGYGSF